MKYTVRTGKAYGGLFYCYVARLVPHRYAKNTAYGERVRLKERGRFTLPNIFLSRLEALRAGRQYVKELLAKN